MTSVVVSNHDVCNNDIRSHDAYDHDASNHDVTQLIEAWQGGDEHALNQLFDTTWRHLHELAGIQLAREAPDCTLQATSLVNEVFLRLAKSKPTHLSDRKSFFCTTARAMKQIRIEQARKRLAIKRGGDRKRVPLVIAIGGLVNETEPDERLLVLDTAMNELKQMFPNHHDLTLLLYCGGLSTKQACSILGIAHRTAQRDWQFAKAFLKSRIQNLTSSSSVDPT